MVELTQALNQVDTYLANNQTRYQLFQEGGIGRAVLHTIGGGILTGDISGAVGAGTTSLAAPVIQTISDNSGSLKPVVDTVGGLAIGYATGGNAGAFTGANADWNNRQLHKDETRLLNKLKQGKSEEEQYRLTAAACALTHCADGVPKSDEYYKVLKDLQTAGEQFTAEKALLQQQGANLTDGKFQYSLTNGGSDDFITRKGKAISKISAGADAVLGSATVVAGYGITADGCATTGIETLGAGCVASFAAGSALTGLGYMQAQSGTNRLLTKYQSPYGNLVLQSLVQETPYYSATNNAAGNVALWTAESFALKGLGKVIGVKGVSPSANKSAKTTTTVTPSAANSVTNASTHFPNDPNQLTKALGVEPKVSQTQHGTLRMEWQPNSDTKIRYESHPLDTGSYNARHHGDHYHIETKPSNLTWNQAKRQGKITKIKPQNYQPGTGTGFLPGEKHPGVK